MVLSIDREFKSIPCNVRQLRVESAQGFVVVGGGCEKGIPQHPSVFGVWPGAADEFLGFLPQFCRCAGKGCAS